MPWCCTNFKCAGPQECQSVGLGSPLPIRGNSFFSFFNFLFCIGTQVQSLGQQDLLEEAWQPTPVFLLGESHGQSSLVDYHSWDCNRPDWGTNGFRRLVDARVGWKLHSGRVGEDDGILHIWESHRIQLVCFNPGRLYGELCRCMCLREREKTDTLEEDGKKVRKFSSWENMTSSTSCYERLKK